MVIKWIVAIFKHPLRILKSIYYKLTNKEEEMSKDRLKICDKCREKQNIKIIGDVCGICGCILDNKTRLFNEKCEMNKW